MSAIFGFTFHIGRMTEVLTPDIYRAHCPSTGYDVMCKQRMAFAMSGEEALCIICMYFEDRSPAANNLNTSSYIFPRRMECGGILSGGGGKNHQRNDDRRGVRPKVEGKYMMY